nr:response regulator [Lachnospiraceae bacterium]
AGAYQLESVSGKMESTINNAEQLTMELAIKAREYLDDKDALKDFIYAQKEEIISGDTGAFNAYIVGSDFCFIPDFDMPDDYNATERVWYTGAIKKQGETYVSSPYQDAMSGDICYTVSVMLGDGDTVLGLDYTLEGIQNYISQMADNAVSAIIVTDEGVIAGCSNKDMVGKKVVNSMPDYAGIYTSAKSRGGVTTGRVKDGMFYENLFATRSGNGWYLIVGISDWELYRNSYIQLAVTILLSVALFSVVVVLYFSAIKNRDKAEQALESREKFLSKITNQLSEPLGMILTRSSQEYVSQTEDYEDEMSYIHTAGKRLSEMMEQIMSYNSIMSSYQKEEQEKKSGRGMSINKKFRGVILAIMFATMCLSLYTNVASSYQWGNTQTLNEAEKYDYQLSEWINTQKSILDMFVSVISTNPEMLDDYEGTVEYLRKITEQYPEISVTYMTNPDLEHTVYMSNGWEPDEGWHVEERQWYIDTKESEKGWSISDPYYDDQTGGYCLTISKMVYDAENGEFLGIFGIDFFMDKLVEILGDSYSENGYAFLVDPEGEIINHPYGAYQMSQSNTTNVQSLVYGEVRPDEKKGNFIKDYDDTYKILYACRNDESNFTVYVVSNSWKIYGRVIIYALICIVAFLFCIIVIYKLLSDFIKLQEKTNKKLSEAADAAIAAGKAKSSFLAQMSHEIRTPINAVLGMNEMIIRETDNEEIMDYAENIRSSGRTLLSLINSILDFSKIEDGKMKLVPVKYSVLSLVNDLVISISERAKEKGLEFDVQVDENLPSTLYGDDVRLRQVIMNLLTNAVKYTEEGRVVLKIWSKEKDGDDFVLFVSVRDTGIGIRQEDMKKLFESFTRLDETRNRNIEGTGLGMSVVTRLLDMMGSSLQVESEYGKGSEFSFEIKQEIINDEPIGNYAERLKHSNDRREEEDYLYVSGASVLVVDDNKMNLKVARSLMKRNGIIPDEAMSGMEAIEKLRNKSYDIVFLDHMMPKMDGVETLKKIKEEKLDRDGCAIIALTANAISGSKEKYLEVGFDDYLTKPIDVIQMEKKFAEWFPEEKYEWRKNENSGRISKTVLIDKLNKIGLNTKGALVFCSGDNDFYLELLSDYVKDYDSKRDALDAASNNENWYEFEVKIHALKSTSKTIGADSLSEMAMELEAAAEKEDGATVLEKYPEFAEKYQDLINEIRSIVNS